MGGCCSSQNFSSYIVTTRRIFVREKPKKVNSYEKNIQFYAQLKLFSELESRSWRSVLDTTACDKVCQ